MTYRNLYETGKTELTAAGIAEAELDARLLLEFVMGTSRNTLLVHGDMEVEAAQEENYLEQIAKRACHIPLQHLTGTQNFMGLDFMVNEDVLIPRQDTEILVEEVLRELHDGMRVLDLCTGSGAIIISLLSYKNDCEGVGSDLSEKALAVAQKNKELLPTTKQERLAFVQGDLFEPVTGKFDRIVSNPPYIATKEVEGLMPEVRDHEPLMALDGEADGLAFYRRIIAGAGEYLYRGGMLYFEIGYDQKDAVMTLMKEAGFSEVTCVQDYAGLDRVVYGTM